MVLPFLLPPQTSSPTRRSLMKSSTSSPSSASSTLVEALRGNPFGTNPRSKSRQTTSHEEDEQERERRELNESLERLVHLFPDISIEVFRELLSRFDGASRLQVCVEQILRHRAEWVKGRWNTDVKKPEVPREEQFRSRGYKVAVKALLCQEFKGLSRSSMDAVLAESNFSYTRARPTLKDLSRKSWRVTIGSIFPFWKKKEKEDVHPLLMLQRIGNGDAEPCLKETGCIELDKELRDTILAPMLKLRRDEREQTDLNLAIAVNEEEATASEALYECDCCYSDSTFEFISSCSASGHIICFDCVRRTIHEALFGQGWGKSIDHERGTLKCLSASIDESCEGCISNDLVERAILFTPNAPKSANEETYRKLEARLAEESLMKSQFKLVRCPFCNYAEVDPTFPPYNRITWHIKAHPLCLLLPIILILSLLPLFILLAPFYILFHLRPKSPPLLPSFTFSLQTLTRKTRTSLFRCQNPRCLQSSCLKCSKPWQPHTQHVCHEPLLTSLRTAVEAARTTAIKRTCPRCGLSFVKSSGCNKLTCVCGYVMCYLCRRALGPKSARRPGQHRRVQRGALAFELDDPDDNDDADPQEGYRHFCDHFRLTPGAPCPECDKCDLYRTEDEEVVVRRAGERAEALWKVRNGVEIEGMGGMGDLRRRAGVGKLDGREGVWWSFVTMWRSCSAQGCLDWVVERGVVVETRLPS
jgi:hypothetical protein